ncbi:MAG: peptidyl-prolyl cis-trans isomerase [Succinivibrionaceae bacterium]|nr:peptidyl-prolyl cis-trans isomerase [Succinivibrionaceae bacterium]
MVILHTNKGDIRIELFSDKAPKTCQNFLEYVKSGHYNGTVFHRVIKRFMIQGGGLTEDLRQKDTRAPVENEADNGLKNEKYTVAMARTNDPHSATSQFFINTAGNDFLNFTDKSVRGWGYCVFGKVTSGQETVDAIEAVATGSRGFYDDVPKEAVIITSAEIEE